MDAACQTPVLFLIQRRPELTLRVLAAIREARPAYLLVAADGPEEDPRCEETRRRVLAEIDWPCTVTTRFSASRLGCRRAISQALDWGFSEHERLIILEDDCLPEPSFFRFCDELLERYAEVPEVMQICGTNLSGRGAEDGSDYYASRFATIWGWASWRRAWQHHDAELSAWPETRRRAEWRRSCRFRGERAWRSGLYETAYAGRVDAWSIAWMFAKQRLGGLSLIPSRNLVSNLGWGQEATHTHDAKDPRACMPTQPLDFPLRHPAELKADDPADLAYFVRYCRPPSLWRRIVNKGRRMLKR